jgi:peptide alpha-N-acetyltransferase
MTLLDLRPQTRAYWVGLAVSYHLLGELDLAIKVLSYFEEFSSSGPNPIMEYEHSELLLYKNHLLIKAERYEDVLTNIEKIRGQVFDQRALKEDRALALLRLKRVEEATLAYQELLKTNPDSKFYIERLLECDNLLGELTEEDQTRLLVKFEDLCRDYPRSHLLKYLPLKHLNDESFKGKVKEYLKANLRKGVPSLFSNLKNLYIDLSKRAIIEELVISFLDNLNKINKFESEDQIEEPITAKLWTLYYLSQHYNKVGNYELAHKYIDEAIDHTPTLVELVKTKAQIYKHQGEIQKAMEIMNEARELDLQDRYINTKCTKYMLRNGKVEEAISTITMFEKPDAVDKVKDLTEIQSIWFIAESARSFYRSNQLGQALKKVYQVDNYYNIMKDDQFDFHSYCMRKLTMRAYSEMIKFEDHLHEYHYYFNNALLGVDCYLQLHDDPINVKKNNDPLTSGQLSEGAKKKLRKKQRQAQEKDTKKSNIIINVD